jgi:hypothetical protein
MLSPLVTQSSTKLGYSRAHYRCRWAMYHSWQSRHKISVVCFRLIYLIWFFGFCSCIQSIPIASPQMPKLCFRSWSVLRKQCHLNDSCKFVANCESISQASISLMLAWLAIRMAIFKMNTFIDQHRERIETNVQFD